MFGITGLTFRRRKALGKHVHINESGSGVSASTTFGPVTVNTHGSVNVKLPFGLHERINIRKFF